MNIGFEGTWKEVVIAWSNKLILNLFGGPTD
jgi:hypothetical protein